MLFLFLPYRRTMRMNMAEYTVQQRLLSIPLLKRCGWKPKKNYVLLLLNGILLIPLFSKTDLAEKPMCSLWVYHHWHHRKLPMRYFLH